ncbi:GNAT family N-acetyltransferase [Parvibaculum sp.]|uniref:GNAT family N-acetyltransferase n=1 Tax=Parvibaculum sp. TaxID=2024848 RepID=UPI001B14638E|nr:GNAT family N-acetyltransferase [Parvibaculum sp.]MBO6633888.1 GNAT family N-acetyltransferase [Parvibaculum sp.]MBO6677898.1 GNAT family N-acetyltransferase [Parvibaculum sp.]MBO6683373.1 GNAT family N-acetyltransferase [Parvibaculum sp.]MBO6904596.1 GNAT family N-acetyltransferase [Parvibaculum sp.]
MKSGPLIIRPFEARDRAAWEAMWAGYLAFYETVLPPETSADTWARFLAAAPGHIGLIAEGEGGPLGFAHAILHPGTWSPKPVCYLEDLYVNEAARGQGAGRALIEALADKGRAEGWLRLYWQTAKDNNNAQHLYDKVAQRTDWVRYELDL